MKTIKKESVLYKTLTKSINNPKDVNAVCTAIIKRIGELYPGKKEQEIVELLNSTVARDFVDRLKCGLQIITKDSLQTRVEWLNQLTFDKYWTWFKDGKCPERKINAGLLYKYAIKSQINKKKPRELMIRLLGCGPDQIWKTPEAWLNSFTTPTYELETMWENIQKLLKDI